MPETPDCHLIRAKIPAEIAQIDDQSASQMAIVANVFALSPGAGGKIRAAGCTGVILLYWFWLCDNEGWIRDVYRSETAILSGNPSNSS
ncbi:hypothetical protein [Albibacillus kandeliae]|uniref:hypothetical protein n=1 Tax=Albibacillus kandeliae TaxID=2174228 RepID=UPI001300B183|nr:hypothetical protein [Albibacillus kandeliae]